MAGMDTIKTSDTSVDAGAANGASAKLSQEANESGRGHAMHGGNENKAAHISPPGIGSHTETQTTPGIDVSEFQNKIDWPQVQKSGVQFAYVRASDGTTIQDSQFVNNYQGAEQAGIPVGAYHYFTTTSAVQTQVDNFVSQLKLVKPGSLPPVLDVEDPTQFSKLTTAQSVQMIQQWLDGVQKAEGVQPMLYMSSAFSAEVLGDAPQFNKYKLWVADYTTAPQPTMPKPWTKWNFWQYTDSGSVPGITGGVDRDTFNGAVQSIPSDQ